MSGGIDPVKRVLRVNLAQRELPAGVTSHILFGAFHPLADRAARPVHIAEQRSQIDGTGCKTGEDSDPFPGERSSALPPAASRLRRRYRDGFRNGARFPAQRGGVPPAAAERPRVAEFCRDFRFGYSVPYFNCILFAQRRQRLCKIFFNIFVSPLRMVFIE